MQVLANGQAGKVAVQQTEDGKGRGLFAIQAISSFLKAIQSLLMSRQQRDPRMNGNVCAAAKIVKMMLKESPRTPHIAKRAGRWAFHILVTRHGRKQAVSKHWKGLVSRLKDMHLSWRTTELGKSYSERRRLQLHSILRARRIPWAAAAAAVSWALWNCRWPGSCDLQVSLSSHQDYKKTSCYADTFAWSPISMESDFHWNTPCHA